jgi:predicted GIY-YIG superfamily endonuclease
MSDLLAPQNLQEVDPWTLPSVPFNEKSKLPEESGIYFCIRDRGILYIGMSKDIKNRWKQHHRHEELLSHSCQKISFLCIPEEKKTFRSIHGIKKHAKSFVKGWFDEQEVMLNQFIQRT